MRFLKKHYRITTLFLIGLFLTYLGYLQDSVINISPATIYCETSTFISQKLVPKADKILNIANTEEEDCTGTAI